MEESEGNGLSKSSGVLPFLRDWFAHAVSLRRILRRATKRKDLPKCPFLNAKTNLAALRVVSSSQKTPGFLMDLGPCSFEAGEFPTWRSLGTLIRDRGNYTIWARGRQHKSNLLYRTRDNMPTLCGSRTKERILLTTIRGNCTVKILWRHRRFWTVFVRG